jgi:hypothetical protein
VATAGGVFKREMQVGRLWIDEKKRQI